MTKSERTKQLILEKTAPLFNRKGFEGTSLTDLTKATGLTKGALYGNFEDKDTIAFAAFHFSMKKVRDLVKKDLDRCVTNKQRLRALLNFYAKYVFDPPISGGCPLLNTAIEADDNRVAMRPVVTKEIMRTVNVIKGLIDNGIKAGEFRKKTDSRALAYSFFCSIEGALMFARVERSREPMKIIVKHCNKILDEISTPYATTKSSRNRARRIDTAGKFGK
jgi:TetR/AcrR family transcriptional regulator, transcriptional repressor for nem operon